ncbi:MAG TPA: DUF4230 domain-containing protein [Verrucomicrobiae bacterium]|jgi:hypothetical protein|nr:DUF4230 domain-containing protein [Verrucomicrobiae bacterium]
MRKTGKLVILLSVAALFAFGIFCGFKLSRLVTVSSAPRSYNTPALLKQVQALSELVTIKYVIEKVEVLEQPSENIVGQMMGSENRMLLLAHGIVKAGIDLNRLKPEDIQINGKTVSIKLPPAQITDSYLDEKQTHVIDRSTGLLAPSAKDLEATVRRNALYGISRAARTSGILSEADQRARAQISNLFKQLGFEKVEFR